ncbi:MAG: DUF2065 domain-containing protein [Kiloniellaceae bacterium]
MSDLLTAVALVFVIEGVFLALFPHRLRQILELMEQMSPDALRLGGLAAAACGVAFVWMLRG